MPKRSPQRRSVRDAHEACGGQNFNQLGQDVVPSWTQRGWDLLGGFHKYMVNIWLIYGLKVIFDGLYMVNNG